MKDGRQLSFHERWGLTAAALKVLLTALRRYLGIHLYGIYAREMEMPSATVPAMPGFIFRMFELSAAEDLIARSTREELGMSAEFIRSALAKGDVCDAVIRDGEVVSYSWSAFTPTRDDGGVFVGFGNRYRYGYKAYTLPAYRGQHLQRVNKPMRDRYCLETRGRTHTIAFISIDNRPSIRMTTSLGYQRAGLAGYISLGPLFIPFRTGGARAQGFYFFMPAKPRHEAGSRLAG